MAAKVRLVKGDQNSAELEALRRSFNSLLLILQNIAAEQAAATTTAVQAAQALSDAIANGIDNTNAPHTGTGRLLYGIKPTPTHPLHATDKTVQAAGLKTMNVADKF